MFLESILFLQKIEKFQKQCCLFWRLSRGSSQSRNSDASSRVNFDNLFVSERSSRKGYTDFCGSACNSFAGRPSICEKHLENFSQFFLWVFWRLDLATCWQPTLVAKNTCLAKTGSVFKSYQFFPRIFYDYSLSLSTKSHPNTSCHSLQTPLLNLYTSKSSKRKGMGSYSLTLYLLFCFIFLSICVGVLIFVMGVFQWFWVCSCLDYLRYCSHANFFQLMVSYIF